MSYGRPPPRIDGMVSLKVDNLTYRTTPEDLRRVFERCGEVGDIYIPRDRFTRESRGFAFVRWKRRPCDIESLRVVIWVISDFTINATPRTRWTPWTGGCSTAGSCGCKWLGTGDPRRHTGATGDLIAEGMYSILSECHVDVYTHYRSRTRSRSRSRSRRRSRSRSYRKRSVSRSRSRSDSKSSRGRSRSRSKSEKRSDSKSRSRSKS